MGKKKKRETKKEIKLKRKRQAEYMQARRQDSEFRDRERRNLDIRKIEIRKWFFEYKKILSCEKCGDSRHYVLEFHHHQGDKEHCISHMVHSGYAKKTILKELKKCKTLCSNCHKEHHFKKGRKKK